jgi:hypothetical protein
VDLTKEFGPSSSGKTIIIASTEGNIAVPEREEKIGLNVYRKRRAGFLRICRASRGTRRRGGVRAGPVALTVPP